MRVKLFSVILLFFIVLSNISFTLTGVCSFIVNKNSFSTYNTINVQEHVQEQCNMLVNIPKNFINVCVKVSYDLKAFAASEDKKQNLVPNNYKFNQAPIALVYSPTKTKAAKSLCEYKNLLFIIKNVPLKMFIVPIIIFYLLCYIGLLRLFGSISLLSLQFGSKDNSVYVLS